MKKQFNVRLVMEGRYLKFDPETMVMMRMSKNGEWVDASERDMRRLKRQLDTGECFEERIHNMRNPVGRPIGS